mgnify:CR=1 FL=1
MVQREPHSEKFRAFRLALKWVGTLGAEAVWALAAFLVCAAFLLAGLKQLFPEATSGMRFFETDAVLAPVSFERGSSRFEVNLPVAGKGDAFDAFPGPVALISRVENEVKNKRAEGIVWERAKAGLELFERDAVQTLNNARATITFDTENVLDMDENSLIIIRRLGRSRMMRSRRSFMVVLNGRLRGRINGSSAGSGVGSVNLQIVLPAGLAEIDTRDSLDQKTEFEITVGSDDSATVTVFKGLAKVSANGKTVEVNANESTKIEKIQDSSSPEVILDAVALSGPADKFIYYYRDFPPEILFQWTLDKKARRYQLHISEKTSFSSLVLNETISETELLYGNLKKGVYLWRVAAVDGNGVTGEWSVARKIEVVQLLTPPRLTVFFPEEDGIINEEAVVVRGVSDPRAKVYINGDPPPQRDQGGFSHEIPLKKGLNLILVESVDPVGNVSFTRRLISRKY